jgi:hypothetical protein
MSQIHLFMWGRSAQLILRAVFSVLLLIHHWKLDVRDIHLPCWILDQSQNAIEDVPDIMQLAGHA